MSRLLQGLHASRLVFASAGLGSSVAWLLWAVVASCGRLGWSPLVRCCSPGRLSLLAAAGLLLVSWLVCEVGGVMDRGLGCFFHSSGAGGLLTTLPLLLLSAGRSPLLCLLLFLLAPR